MFLTNSFKSIGPTIKEAKGFRLRLVLAYSCYGRFQT
jgi:hypothetical protein